MNGRKDYYAVLEVASEATPEEIKRAYRKLARKWHPDVNPGDSQAEERFKEISEAYHVLGDAERRKTYDNVGPEQFAQQVDMSDFAEQFGAFFGGRGGATAGGFGPFEDLFAGGGFGPGSGAQPGSRRRVRPAAGRDVSVTVQLSIDEAVSGTERQVRYRVQRGATAAQARVRIPPGARDGTRIRLRGKGEQGSQGGPAGDLYLEVRLAPNDLFRLQGDDLHTEVPITIYEAALGDTIDVPTLDGSARITVPPGTRSGQRFRIRGHGAPRRKGEGRGDVIATVQIVLPDQLDAGTEELMRRLRDDHPYAPRGAATKAADR